MTVQSDMLLLIRFKKAQDFKILEAEGFRFCCQRLKRVTKLAQLSAILRRSICFLYFSSHYDFIYISHLSMSTGG